MSDDLEQTIREQAAEPASMSSDGQSVTSRPLTEQIEADRYLASKQAMAKKNRGLRYSKFSPGGSN